MITNRYLKHLGKQFVRKVISGEAAKHPSHAQMNFIPKQSFVILNLTT
jgi:hypothetical protein